MGLYWPHPHYSISFVYIDFPTRLFCDIENIYFCVWVQAILNDSMSVSRPPVSALSFLMNLGDLGKGAQVELQVHIYRKQFKLFIDRRFIKRIGFYWGNIYKYILCKSISNGEKLIFIYFKHNYRTNL